MGHDTSFFRTLSQLQNSKDNPISGALNILDRKILQFSTEIDVFLRNGTRKNSAYFGSLIGSLMQPIDPVADPRGGGAHGAPPLIFGREKNF